MSSEATPVKNIAPQELNKLVRACSTALSRRLQAHGKDLFPPDARKVLRKFTSGEVAKLLGIKDGYLRSLSLEGKGPQPETSPGGRRLYSASEILELRQYLAANGRQDRRYLPGRSGGDHLQVMAVVNFKGGSGKTTVSAHAAQGLALAGYRILMIDLDPQASLTTLHGYQPEIDIAAGKTLYGAIRYDDPCPLKDVILPTCFPNLDIVPADLELMDFEHDTPRHLVARQANGSSENEMFFNRIGEALAQVADDYDLVIIDCPPQLGFLTLSALCAATSMLVTVHPQMIDVMSMNQFLAMTAQLMDVVSDAGGDMQYDFLRFVMTRHEPGDGPQTQMAAFLRSLFGNLVLTNTMLKSAAIADAGITKQTIFEVERNQFTRSTYDRAMESVQSMNGEIEMLIQDAWGRGPTGKQTRSKSVPSGLMNDRPRSDPIEPTPSLMDGAAAENV